MSWFSSTPAKKPPPSALDVEKLSAPALDITRGTFSGDYLKQLQEQGAAALKAAKEGAAAQAKQGSTAWFLIKWVLFPLVLIFGAMLIYDAVAPCNWPNLLLPNNAKCGPGTPGTQVPASSILYIGYARYGTDNKTNYQDVTAYLSALIKDEIYLPPFTVGYANLGLAADPYPGKLKTLYIQYYVGTGGYTYTQADDGNQFPALPEASGVQAPNPNAYDAPSPPFFSKLYNSIFGNSSGNLAPAFHDATSSATIKGNSAPLSAEREGGYGMQWWMYVKDWNYGYGKKKAILRRPDTTNKAIMNPEISLHPTDNTMQISVSVYPNSEGGSGKAQPAPAGHSGSTDDVFVCDVTNIPLQTWFSVSVTVFGRNLDVYIDGKLVKSCFLSGVPKPAVSDIQLTPDGGFSGRVCQFYHYPRMLTPSDALAFWSAGTSCKNQTAAGGSATGYSVKFGVYDSLGKEVQEYAF
jgi:hypothetical protein